MVKAQELGISHHIDGFASDLWRRARSLTAHLESESSTSGFDTAQSALPTTQTLTSTTQSSPQPLGSSSTSSSTLLPTILVIKVVLLLAARSFAAPSEYLKLHLETISSAIQASLDSRCDDGVSLEERERRWQLWSFLCVLDWTSPGIYHNGSYIIRPELHSNPPSKIKEASENAVASPGIETERFARLRQTRYFIEHALALAHLSRRAEDCMFHPGAISSAQAAELCAELDALDKKLSVYQLLGNASTHGGDDGSANENASSIIDAGGTLSRVGRGHPRAGSQVAFQTTLLTQSVYLNLELSLIRYRLFRREAFDRMQDATASGALRMMCIDTCMDACILVLSQCRSIGMSHQAKHSGVQGMQSMAPIPPQGSGKESRTCPGTFRRIIQPASSAALIGQVLLYASQSAHQSGISTQERRMSTPRSAAGISTSSTTGGNSASEFYSYANPSAEISAPRHSTSSIGTSSRPGQLGQDKVSTLQSLINGVIEELEALQSTLPLAKHKLRLHQQCR